MWRSERNTLSVLPPSEASVCSPAHLSQQVGELLHHMLRLSAIHTGVMYDAHFEPWEYAVIGASAFCAGVTRTVSTPLLFIELAGENHLGAPLLIPTLVAYCVGNCFTPSIYDALAYTNGAPTLPALLNDDHAYLPARAVMQPVRLSNI
jgi:H+/Cl- antiporter ClcA